MKRHKEKYDIVVVGGGHAGVEAALISANLGLDTLLISMDEKSIGRTSCNPAIGGLAKGQMVKEVDVLGGVMGFFADKCTLQSKTLNKSKGRSVWSPRSQIDKLKYETVVQEHLASSKLNIFGGEVVSIDTKKNKVCGVLLKDKTKIRDIYKSRLIILADFLLNSRFFKVELKKIKSYICLMII